MAPQMVPYVVSYMYHISFHLWKCHIPKSSLPYDMNRGVGVNAMEGPVNIFKGCDTAEESAVCLRSTTSHTRMSARTLSRESAA